MNVLKRCIFGIGLLSLALVSVQCKNDKKMDFEVKKTDAQWKAQLSDEEYKEYLENRESINKTGVR